MRKNSLYGFFCVVSIVVRQFVLPNPFKCFGDKALFINLIAEPIIHAVAFSLVGLVYRKRSNPGWGSFLYLFTYAIIVGVLLLLGIFKFAWWWVLILILVFIGFVIGIRLLCRNLESDDYYD